MICLIILTCVYLVWEPLRTSDSSNFHEKMVSLGIKIFPNVPGLDIFFEFGSSGVFVHIEPKKSVLPFSVSISTISAFYDIKPNGLLEIIYNPHGRIASPFHLQSEHTENAQTPSSFKLFDEDPQHVMVKLGYLFPDECIEVIELSQFIHATQDNINLWVMDVLLAYKKMNLKVIYDGFGKNLSIMLNNTEVVLSYKEKTLELAKKYY
jgi:hypothetical protein